MRALYILLVVALAAALTTACAKAPPEPKRMLPQRPAAYYDTPAGLTPREVEMCKLARQRKEVEGWLKDLPSLCQKAEYNYLGWQFLREWVARLYDSIFNRDGTKEGRSWAEYLGV